MRTNPKSTDTIYLDIKFTTLLFETIMTVLQNATLFTTRHKNFFRGIKTVYSVDEHDTRNSNNLHPSLVNLSKFRKGPYIMCIKVYNYLPLSLRYTICKPAQFRSLLKRFLYHHSFYSVEEYFNYKDSS
jgi:hypothetical protein